jgi:hypothetical protein
MIPAPASTTAAAHMTLVEHRLRDIIVHALPASRSSVPASPAERLLLLVAVVGTALLLLYLLRILLLLELLLLEGVVAWSVLIPTAPTTVGPSILTASRPSLRSGAHTPSTGTTSVAHRTHTATARSTSALLALLLLLLLLHHHLLHLLHLLRVHLSHGGSHRVRSRRTTPTLLGSHHLLHLLHLHHLHHGRVHVHSTPVHSHLLLHHGKVLLHALPVLGHDLRRHAARGTSTAHTAHATRPVVHALSSSAAAPIPVSLPAELATSPARSSLFLLSHVAARLSLLDLNRLPVDLEVGCQTGLDARVALERHEAETTRTTRVLVHHQGGVDDAAEAGKVLAELVICGLLADTTNENLASLFLLVAGNGALGINLSCPFVSKSEEDAYSMIRQLTILPSR